MAGILGRVGVVVFFIFFRTIPQRSVPVAMVGLKNAAKRLKSCIHSVYTQMYPFGYPARIKQLSWFQCVAGLLVRSEISTKLNSGSSTSYTRCPTSLGITTSAPHVRPPRLAQVGLLPHRGPGSVRVRTIDTGGAGPVSGLLEAARMVKARREKGRVGGWDGVGGVSWSV